MAYVATNDQVSEMLRGIVAQAHNNMHEYDPNVRWYVVKVEGRV